MRPEVTEWFGVGFMVLGIAIVVLAFVLIVKARTP